MARFTLGQLAQIAEVVAAIAVVASLLYVGQEVKNNTNAVRGAAMQAVASPDADAVLSIASDSALSRILQIGSQDPSLLTEAEAFRFFLFQRQFWLRFQNVFQQTDLGLLDSSVWRGYLSIVCEQWAFPGVRDSWPNHRSVVDPRFAETVERCGTDR